MKPIRLNKKFNFFLISDSIPGVGGGKSEEDEVSKEDQVTVIHKIAINLTGVKKDHSLNTSCVPPPGWVVGGSSPSWEP